MPVTIRGVEMQRFYESPAIWGAGVIKCSADPVEAVLAAVRGAGGKAVTR
ncbi:hypothetical protein [Rubrivivax gelatinosus]|nr:hypothetical protein [Rubrivivax gelatinosus]MBG6083080.1 hypothetical protein [Rubrivivax gelatinosus]